jgi:hypothetical protein
LRRCREVACKNIKAAKDAGIRHAYQFTGIHELKQDLQLVGINI